MNKYSGHLSTLSKSYVILGAALFGVIAMVALWRLNDVPFFLGFLDDDIQIFQANPLHFDRATGQSLVPHQGRHLCSFFRFLSGVLGRLTGNLLAASPYIDEQRKQLFLRLLSFSVYTMGFLVGIHVENINLSTLGVMGATLGVGVGFGLQPLVANFVAGIILLVEQPLRIGDKIEFDNRTGEVVRVGLRSSWIRTYNNAIAIIPNSEFTSKQILNWTASDPKVRISVPVSVARGSHPDQVMQTLLQVAAD